MNQKSPFTKHLPKHAPSARSISILFFSVFGLFRARSLKWIFRKVGPNVHLNHSKDQCWLVLIGDLSYLLFWGMIIHSTKSYFHVSSMMGWGYLFIPGVTRPGMKPKCCDASVDASWCVSCFQWCLTCLPILPERSQLKIPCWNRPCAEVWRDSKEDWTAALEDFEHLALKSGANFVVFQRFNIS